MTGEKKEVKKKCKYALVDYKCSREALPGDEHCSFHSKDIEGKKDRFNDAFWKEFERQKKHGEIYDFTGFVFPGHISFSGKKFEKGIYFRGTKFSGRADFGDAQFSGEAYFGKAQFAGEAHFNKARFKEDTNFVNIEIEKYNNSEMIDTYFYNLSGLFEYIEENDKVFKKLRKRSKTLKTEFLPKNFKLILGEGVTARYPVQSRQIKDDMYLLDKKERNSRMKGVKKCWYKTFYFLWWFTADYGRRFWRWALCCAIIAFIFGAVFSNCGAPDWATIQGFFLFHQSRIPNIP